MNAREKRKAELLQMADSMAGRSEIRKLYLKSMGLSEDTELDYPRHTRQELIPAILDAEFPPEDG